MAIYFTLAKPLQRLPKPVAIIVDMYHDVKHMAFKGEDALCTVSDNDHSVVGHLEDLAVDAVHLIPYLVLALALVVGALYLPALAKGIMTLPAINNPVPNVPANTVPLQPSTFTPIPTSTPTPSATPTVAVTETPTFVMPEIEKTPITIIDLNRVPEYHRAQPVELEILLNVILPKLGVGKGWSYSGAGTNVGSSSSLNIWLVFPSQAPAKGQENLGYFVSAEYITPILFDSLDYKIFNEISKDFPIIPVP